MNFKSNFFIIFFIFIILGDSSFSSDFGITGLFDTPTARMNKDGTFSTTISKHMRDFKGKKTFNEENMRMIDTYNLTYQASPWLETTFRYSTFHEYDLFDRSWDFKIKIIEEGKTNPELALGVRDAIGTGAFTSEYIVTNKKVGDFDFSLGLGWGRMAIGSEKIKNPLSIVLPETKNRNDYQVGEGGRPRFQSYFRGEEVGFFGGIKYDLLNNLDLMIEYNPDRYDMEVRQGTDPVNSPFTYGLKWSPIQNIDLTFSKQHNDYIGFNITSKIDTSYVPEKKDITVIFPESELYDESYDPNNLDDWYGRLRIDMHHFGLILYFAELHKDNQTITLGIGNKQHLLWADALSLAQKVSDIYLPENIVRVNFVLIEDHVRVNKVETKRYAPNFNSEASKFSEHIEILPLTDIRKPTKSSNLMSKKLNLDTAIHSRFHLFDPDLPLQYQFFANLKTYFNLPKGYKIRAAYH